MAKNRQVKCPTCGALAAFDPSNHFRPFCSERCRTMDLGAWAAERHRIAGDPLEAAFDAPIDTTGDAASDVPGPGTPKRNRAPSDPG
jgi:hypothetical protein